MQDKNLQLWFLPCFLMRKTWGKRIMEIWHFCKSLSPLYFQISQCSLISEFFSWVTAAQEKLSFSELFSWVTVCLYPFHNLRTCGVHPSERKFQYLSLVEWKIWENWYWPHKYEAKFSLEPYINLASARRTGLGTTSVFCPFVFTWDHTHVQHGGKLCFRYFTALFWSCYSSQVSLEFVYLCNSRGSQNFKVRP